MNKEAAHALHSGEHFGHREHVELAFTAVRKHGMPAAIDHVSDVIRQIAAYQRVPQKYHHTVSVAWMEVIAHHGAADATDFEEFVEQNSALLDKRLLSAHYNNSTLSSEPARTGWVEPDLAPFPWRGDQR